MKDSLEKKLQFPKLFQPCRLYLNSLVSEEDQEVISNINLAIEFIRQDLLIFAGRHVVNVDFENFCEYSFDKASDPQYYRWFKNFLFFNKSKDKLRNKRALKLVRNIDLRLVDSKFLDYLEQREPDFNWFHRSIRDRVISINVENDSPRRISDLVVSTIIVLLDDN